LRKLYERELGRAELDAGQFDPGSNEFVNLSNGPKFQPEVSEVAGGAVQELLDVFDPSELRQQRSGARLGARWQKLRSLFTVAYTNWSKSGQNDDENFTLFSEGVHSWVYAFYVFRRQPSLNFALRLLPEGARVESRIPGEDISLDRTVMRERRRASKANSVLRETGSVGEYVADSMSFIVDALRQMVLISSQHPSSPSKEKHEETTSMATALESNNVSGVDFGLKTQGVDPKCSSRWCCFSNNWEWKLLL
jgi:hypothetical protein